MADIERTFAEILVSADPARFDGSDLMPGAVGAGSLWKQGTNCVTGARTSTRSSNTVEESWPAS